MLRERQIQFHLRARIINQFAGKVGVEPHTRKFVAGSVPARPSRRVMIAGSGALGD